MRRASLWRWAGAMATGTSHSRANEPRQDFAAATEYALADGTAFLAVVCDGAGSAIHGGVGSRATVLITRKLVRDHFISGGTISSVDEECCAAWLSQIRSQLARRATNLGSDLRQLATTMTLVLVGDANAVVLQVGDSVCVIHDGDKWVAPVWPMRGEYANQTYFITNIPNPVWTLAKLDKRIDRLAVFSDGIDKLVLNHRERIIFEPFFDGVLGALAKGLANGRNRVLSKGIGGFLESERVISLTDDDKTLIIAARTSSVSR